METIFGFLGNLVAMYGETFPMWLVNLFVIIGSLRVFIKPLTALAEAIVAYTESDKDDIKLEQVKKSKVYSFILFLIDWTTSLKLPKKK